MLRQDPFNPQVDDPDILDSDDLLRVCRTPWQIRFDPPTEKYVLSSQVFSSLQLEDSKVAATTVSICRLYEAQGVDDAQVIGVAPNGYGGMRISAGAVRSVKIKDANGKDSGLSLGVAYTPLTADHPGGPDQFHGDIFPKATSSMNTALTRLARQAGEVDQTVAKEMYDRGRR